MDHWGQGAGIDRQTFLRCAATAGVSATAASSLAVLYPLHAFVEAAPAAGTSDHAILVAAQIAEALAVTTYTAIIEKAPFYGRLEAGDQGYLKAARQEEMSHYLLEQLATGQAAQYTRFYYPRQMFASAKVTLNTLVVLEDAFIAAYLLGIAHFSSGALRLTAARIMGIESDHRTLARVLAGNVKSQDGGPLTALTGFQGVAEGANPPNNNGYERTLGWTSIDQAIAALQPYIDKKAAAKAGFDTAKAYIFRPFTPALPTKLGAFHSFSG